MKIANNHDNFDFWQLDNYNNNDYDYDDDDDDMTTMGRGPFRWDPLEYECELLCY